MNKLIQFSIAKFFPPEAGEKEFYSWVMEEISKFPQGKSCITFSTNEQKSKEGRLDKNLVTANVTIFVGERA